VPKTYIGKKTTSSTNGAGNTGCLHVEDKLNFCFTISKNQFKIDQRPNARLETTRRKHRENA
jgi:hypothetical protein